MGSFVSVSAGGNHTCGMRSNSSACWGSDEYGHHAARGFLLAHGQGRRANTCGHRRADDAKRFAHEHPAAHSPPPNGAQTPPETEREALVALYNATGGPNWEGNNNWLSDVPISEWEGVTNDDNGRVTQLNLSWNQLSGEIPPQLGNLAKLDSRLN